MTNGPRRNAKGQFVSRSDREGVRTAGGTNVGRFSLEMRAAGEEVPRRLMVENHRRLSIRLLQGVTFRTPVDTGFARSNWQVGVAATNESLITALRSAQQVVEEGRAALKSLEAFSVVYVFNNASYINVLESGAGSAQAPNGMVQVTLNDLRAFGELGGFG